MKLQDVASYHAEQALEASACNERQQEKLHLEMLSAILKELEEVNG